MRRALAALYRDLTQRGLNTGSAGNVSARSKTGMLITPTGLSGDEIASISMVETTLDGVSKSHLAPSSEWAMHAAIYRSNPKAQVIVHTHSDAATALACLNLPLPPFHYAVLAFGGPDVRVAPYVTFGTQELAEAVVQAIAGRTACLLANHGMICHAATPAAALQAALLLEALCRQYLLAMSVGQPRLLTEPELDAARARFATYGQQAAKETP
jgi:L-fuculose-phosphate aldolase